MIPSLPEKKSLLEPSESVLPSKLLMKKVFLNNFITLFHFYFLNSGNNFSFSLQKKKNVFEFTRKFNFRLKMYY